MTTNDKPPIMVTLRLNSVTYWNAAVPYVNNRGVVNGQPLPGDAGVSVVERYLRAQTGNTKTGECMGNQLVWFRAGAPERVVTWNEMWAEMQTRYNLRPVGKNHPDQYGRSENWLKTSATLSGLL